MIINLDNMSKSSHIWKWRYAHISGLHKIKIIN